MVNYLLLRADTVITGCNFKTWRLFLSACLGGIFSLIIYIDNIPIYLNIIIKISFLSVMVITAFKINSLKIFLKHFAAFSVSNFIFGGIMLAVNILFLPETSLYNNGIIYFDIDILSLTIASIICYMVLNLINKHIKTKSPPKSIYPIKITYKSKTVEGKALFDSGNTLCDCFSGRPVIIAEKEFIKNLLRNEKTENAEKFRLIPFSTISGNGTLPSFMSDKAEVFFSGKWHEANNIFIGITDKKIISGSYSALLGAPFFESVQTNNNNNSEGDYEI